MDLQTYRQRKAALIADVPTFRNLCLECRQPDWSCYCQHISQFDPKINFIILTHKLEVRRRIATGRMSHLSLKNSELIMGQDFSNCDRVNAIIANPSFDCCVLYPGKQSTNLSMLPAENRGGVFCADKIPVIFVIDGTWNTARKTMWLSQNLRRLPQLSFIPPYESRFRVRKQPRENCLSTIEAIHHLIDLLGSRPGFDVHARMHDGMLRAFDMLVERQIELAGEQWKLPSRHR